jgi:hypothetical protein
VVICRNGLPNPTSSGNSTTPLPAPLQSAMQSISLNCAPNWSQSAPAGFTRIHHVAVTSNAILFLLMSSPAVTNLLLCSLTTVKPRPRNSRSGARSSTVLTNLCTRGKSYEHTPLRPPASTTFLTAVDRAPPFPPQPAPVNICTHPHPLPQLHFHCIARIARPSVGAV